MPDVEKTGSAADDLKPVFDGIEEIAKFTTKSATELKQDIKALAETQDKRVNDLDDKIEKGLDNILDRVDNLSKRASFVNRMGSMFEQDDLASVKEVVPERFLKNMGGYEMESVSHKGGLFSDPRGVAATHAWFNLSTRLQMRRFDSERERNHKEFQTLNERMALVQRAAMGGATDSAGGYMIPNIVGNEVLKLIRDASLIYNRARQLQMTSDTLQFPDEATAVTVAWFADSVTLTGGEPVLGQKTLTAKKLVGRATFSLELLDDSNVAVIPFLQSCFVEKMGGELDFQCMEGNAVFSGVQNATSVGDAGATNGTNGVVLKYQTTASTQASLVKIFTLAGEAYTRDQGIFVCNPGVYAQIIGLTDSNGQPVVRLGTVEGQPNNTLFGRPIVVSNRLAKTTVGAGTVSVGSLYFGPPSALLFGVRTNMRWDVTDQVSWSTYAADARLVGRFAFVVGVPTAWTKQFGIIV